MGGKSWEDALLAEREENKRLKAQQAQQAEREERLTQRLIVLKEQSDALKAGKAIDSIGRDGKVRELQDKYERLKAQQRELEMRLDAARGGGGAKTASGRRPATAGAGGRQAQFTMEGIKDTVEDLKAKILQTNMQIKRLEEQRVTSDLRSTLDRYRTDFSEADEDAQEREELRRELKQKEAKYTLARSKFESIDAEYKDYVNKHRDLMAQAEAKQREISEQQRVHRELEVKIKALKLQKDRESDLKSIVDDMREELELLKEENRVLKEDSMSGSSLMSKSEKQYQEVEKLRAENEELLRVLDEQRMRSDDLGRTLQEAQLEQQALLKALHEREGEVQELSKTHASLTASLAQFSADPGAESASARAQAAQASAGQRGWQSDALGRVVRQLRQRGSNAAIAFDEWNTARDGQLTSEQLAAGLVGCGAGLQQSEAAQLVSSFGAGAAITREVFESTLRQAQESADDKAAPAGESGDDGAGLDELRQEVRKLRTIKAELLREKDELFLALRANDQKRQVRLGAGEAALAERIAEVEQRHAAEIRELEEELAVAQYNQQDLLQLIRAHEAGRVRKSAAEDGKGRGAKNVLVLEVGEVRLDGLRAQGGEEPTTFLSIDFFAHDTQVTRPVTGFEVNVGWSGEFEVEVDDVLLDFLARDKARDPRPAPGPGCGPDHDPDPAPSSSSSPNTTHNHNPTPDPGPDPARALPRLRPRALSGAGRGQISVELLRRVHQDVPYTRVAAAAVSLADLLDRPAVSSLQPELRAPDGARVGVATLSARLLHPITQAVQRYRADAKGKARAGVEGVGALAELGVPTHELKLSVHVAGASNVRSKHYGKLPHAYVQYELPGSLAHTEPHITATVAKSSAPDFNDVKVWALGSEQEVASLRGRELEFFVMDDDEDDGGDVAGGGYLGLASIKLAPLFSAAPPALEAALELRDPRGVANGTLRVKLAWEHPLLEERRAAALAAAVAPPAPASPVKSAAAAAPAPTASEATAWAAADAAAAWAARLRAAGQNFRDVFNRLDEDGDHELSAAEFAKGTASEVALALDAGRREQLFAHLAQGGATIKLEAWMARMTGAAPAAGEPAAAPPAAAPPSPAVPHPPGGKPTARPHATGEAKRAAPAPAPAAAPLTGPKVAARFTAVSLEAGGALLGDELRKVDSLHLAARFLFADPADDAVARRSPAVPLEPLRGAARPEAKLAHAAELALAGPALAALDAALGKDEADGALPVEVVLLRSGMPAEASALIEVASGALSLLEAVHAGPAGKAVEVALRGKSADAPVVGRASLTLAVEGFAAGRAPLAPPALPAAGSAERRATLSIAAGVLALDAKAVRGDALKSVAAVAVALQLPGGAGAAPGLRSRALRLREAREGSPPREELAVNHLFAAALDGHAALREALAGSGAAVAHVLLLDAAAGTALASGRLDLREMADKGADAVGLQVELRETGAGGARLAALAVDVAVVEAARAAAAAAPANPAATAAPATPAATPPAAAADTKLPAEEEKKSSAAPATAPAAAPAKAPASAEEIVEEEIAEEDNGSKAESPEKAKPADKPAEAAAGGAAPEVAKPAEGAPAAAGAEKKD